MLTSAHVAMRTGELVDVFRPGHDGTLDGQVVWCGTPGGRDDAALVLLEADPVWRLWPGAARWGRLVTDRPGATCQTWGLPDVAQRPGQPVEAVQLQGRINPGTGFVGNRYVMDLLQHPPRWWKENSSPWGGLSGAAVFCGRLLAGVVASDREHSEHGQLNVVPTYVLHHDPRFRAALAEHGTRPAGLEAAELQHLDDADTVGGGAGPASPAALLQPGRQTVPFHGREELLQRMRGWCSRDGFGAWLLHGPGGQGKTRLAHHLAGLLAADGWAVLWPRAGADASELRELRDVAKPLLVVLDYAEARTGQLTALVDAGVHAGGAPFKVLLLARTDGDWWTQARSATRLAEDHLDDAPAVGLAPLEQAPGSRAQAYRAAARALADALPRVRGLADQDWTGAAVALPAPRLGDDVFANALTLQMTVLADLLDSAAPAAEDSASSAADRAQEVEDRLLGHERRYWQHGAHALGLADVLSRSTLEKALAAAHLVGAADREQADRTWVSIPALADQARDRRDRVTAWVAALYPPAVSDKPWGALQPDRLAERHIGRALDSDPALAEHLIHSADSTQTVQLLTVYSRAAAHSIFGGRLDGHLTNLCIRLRHQLAPYLVTTVVQTDYPQPLIAALDTIVADPNAELDDLTSLFDQFPQISQRLASTAVCLAQTISNRYSTLAEADPDAYLPALAMALSNLAVRLGEVGRRAEGLAVIEEAVGIRRALSEVDPDAYLPALASSLNTLATRLMEMGRRREGLSVIEEAVRHYRILVEVDAKAYLPDLATCLNNLANHLGEMGRRAEGLAAIEEAVRIRRAVAEASGGDHLPAFAMSLNTLSVRLGEMGRRVEGLAAIEEAVQIRRALAEVDPDIYLPALANSLNNLVVRLWEMGRRVEGHAAIEEAVRHYRALADSNSDAYLPALANSLNNLAASLWNMRRQVEGFAVIEEAVRIRRTLSESNPDVHLPALATCLNNMSNQLGDMGRSSEGLAAIQEAVRIRRALADSNPDAYLPALAMSLVNLSNRLGDVGRSSEGLAAVEEAVRIRRALADSNPDAYLPALAMSLNSLSNRLGDVGRSSEGLAAVEEAVRIRRALADS
ncbi:tetratricopeptide repeat protein, partial [Streptomyces sp. NPDC001941]|uniref:tetratricopeptide repeat protein n=1 Tax=Streptomyces sp. NPDC001941 TaxID=3154659 RepID=UPI00331F2419